MMKKIYLHKGLLYIAVLIIMIGCEEFVTVDIPDDRISGSSVFKDETTAQRAMDGVYNQLFQTNFASGGNRSVTFIAGLSADLLTLTTTIGDMEQFAGHEIDPVNGFNRDLWAGAYNTIYMCNAILEGIQANTFLGQNVSTSLKGESQFLRAFSYFYLAQLYGDVPLILSTDYRNNAIAPRAEKTAIMNQILMDLQQSIELLDTAYPDGERTRVNRYTAMALLARVHLYLENWEQAERWSSEVLGATAFYELETDPNAVFLANSQEALWQLSPAGWGNSFTHTREGNLFVRISTNGSPVTLSTYFMDSWESGDLRRDAWVGEYSDGNTLFYYPNKYKLRYDASGGGYAEYSVIMRLAELYLVRAEARAHIENLEGALKDIDEIRGRAGIDLLTDSGLTFNQQDVLQAVAKERQQELFAEWGHRWLDLKRTKQADVVLGNQSAFWEATDVLYPIPDEDRMKNPNLTQNEGY